MTTLRANPTAESPLPTISISSDLASLSRPSLQYPVIRTL
uniref:Uncharacterized protein n=1 Tax=Arundo donax TaxID=35708 RepID=A0A0A9FFA5_ARUDO